MKSNSINFVFHGDGLKDMFVDDISVPDRMATEVQIIGNTPGGKGAHSNIVHQVNEAVGLPQDDKSIVMLSGNGVKIFTQKYVDELEEWDINLHQPDAKPLTYGDTSQIEINGKPLSEILAECSNGRFEEYHTAVTNAAAQALIDVNRATNFNDV